jgi:uncharacterized protein
VRNVLIDAGPMIALFDMDDACHDMVEGYLRSYPGRLHTTWPVLTEASQAVSFSIFAQENLLTWVRRNGVYIFALSASHMDRIIELLRTHAGLPLDFPDCSLLVAAEELGILDVMTIAADYSAYKLSNGRALRNVLRE